MDPLAAWGVRGEVELFERVSQSVSQSVGKSAR